MIAPYYVDTETGEIIQAARLRKYQRLVQRQHRTTVQKRYDSHFPKAMLALSWCLLLSVLVAYIAVNSPGL